MLIEVPDEVAARLQEMAEARRITVGELVDILIMRDAIETKRVRKEWDESNPEPIEHPPPPDIMPGDEGWPPPGSLAELAQLARKANLGALGKKQVDTSARSREILNAEFADYITRNWDK